MKLDSEQQRQILIALIDNANFPGTARKAIYELGEVVAKAEITELDGKEERAESGGGEDH